MKYHASPFIAAIVLLFLVPCLSHGQELPEGTTTDPGEAQFVTTDLENFVRAFGMLGPGSDTASILQKEYIDRGTPGLKIFIEKYDLTPTMMVKAIRSHPGKYASLDRLPEAVDQLTGLARNAFVRYKEVAPNVVFPPTYFLVESFRGINSGSTEGQLISVEKWTPPVDHEITMIVHELTHFQQVVAIGYEKYVKLFNTEKNLLGLCIREGTAEFFAGLVTGKITQDEAMEYTIQNEKKLWSTFREEMSGKETGDWMWKKPEDPDQPMHVGYVVGSRIVKSFYDRAGDKADAIKKILSVTDYPAFLTKSGYAAGFGK